MITTSYIFDAQQGLESIVIPRPNERVGKKLKLESVCTHFGRGIFRLSYPLTHLENVCLITGLLAAARDRSKAKFLKLSAICS